jgi:predicted anti-sigma-YlaC factor YlaD
MHRCTRDQLESLLASEQGNAGLDENSAKEHLAHCSECAKEVATMSEQAQFLRLLRAPEGMEPNAGFYARVLQRIEERAKQSIWTSLIYSPISSRIAYASLTVALALGSYVIAAESHDGHLSKGIEYAQSVGHYDAPVVGDRTQQRDAVLENFAVH